MRQYRADGRVLSEFVSSNAPFSCIQGPVGSGTTTGMIMRMLRHAMEQEPNAEGVRRTWFICVRPTYPLLRQTFLKSYREWLRPGENGMPDMTMTAPYQHHIKDCPQANLPDGTKLDMQVTFLAVEPDNDDYEWLGSWEPTGFLINEAQQYVGRNAIDAMWTRVAQGRFPPKIEGGPTWHGMLLDLNAPPEGHWIPYMRGDVPLPDFWTDDQRRNMTRPEGWEFFLQPAGLIENKDERGKVIGYRENPDAENKAWRNKSYVEMANGMPSKSEIDTKLMNRIGLLRKGEPVFPMFSEARHVDNNIQPVPGIPLVVGIDAARNPFATVWQNVRGSWRCYAELGMRSVSAATFGPELKGLLFSRFPEFVMEGMGGAVQGVNFWCDPSAVRRGDGTDDSFYSILRGLGIMANPAPGNNLWEARRGAMEGAMKRITPNGDMGMLIHGQNCRVLKTALYSGYVLGDDNMPNKGKSGVYADAADSAQYALLGGGEGQAILRPAPREKMPETPEERKSGYAFKRVRGSRRS